MQFNGERLKIARLYRNMTISELAEKVSVTKQAISQYENNQTTPKADILFQFVSALGFPVGFFTEKDGYRVNINNTFFRALSTTKALDLNTQEVKTAMIVRVYNFLSKYLNFPLFELPKIESSDFEDVEKVAILVRSQWGLGEQPITNMVSLLEKKGVIVSSLLIDNKKIDAFTQVHTLNGLQQFCLVLSNDKQSMVRRNFDAAHELGHIILHNKLTNIKELSKEEFKKMENEANQFAAAFLMPKNRFFAELINPTSLDTYLQLKKKWKVSIAAMVMRAKQLNRINNVQYQSLMKQISYRKWREVEPFDDIWGLQRPVLFKKALLILKENNVLTGQQLLYELSRDSFTMNGDEIETLLGLDKGTIVEGKEKAEPALVLSLKREKKQSNIK